MLQKADVAEVLAAERRHGTKSKSLVWIVAGAILLAATVGWFVWQAASKSGASTYVTESIAPGDLHVSLVATGTLQPVHDVAVSSIVAGTIVSVDVDYGQAVVTGQPLAHLDPSDLKAQLDHAQALVDAQTASRDAAAANVDDAVNALHRAHALPLGDTITSKDLELATSSLQRAHDNLAVSEAQLRATQAELATARSNLGKAVIVAPIDGVVLDVNAEAGQSIGAASLGTPLFRVASDLATLNLEIDVDEADVAQLKQGQAVSFTVEAAPDHPFSGTIAQVRSAPTVSDGVVSYKAIVPVENPGRSFRPGMTATADIALAEARDILTVPNSALRFAPPTNGQGGLLGFLIPKQVIEAPPAGPHVWILRDGTPRPVGLTVGLTDGQRSEVVSGDINKGDLVITASKGR